jgi:hypothetical protein
MCHWNQTSVICQASPGAVLSTAVRELRRSEWLNCTAEPARRQEDAEAPPQHLLYQDMLSQMPPQGQDRNSKHWRFTWGRQVLQGLLQANKLPL